MFETLAGGLLWFLAVGCGLIAGLFFAFSTFIMTALGRIPHAQGAAAMNAINATIVRSLFMPVFLGTTLASLLLAALGFFSSSAGASALMIGAGIVYAAGMFGITMLFNVPLNNALAGADPSSPAGVSTWKRYLKEWTAWNHARTLASTAACALYIAAIAASHA